MKFFGKIENAGSNFTPHISNMRLSYSGGTFKIVGADGNDLSATNPATITINYGITFKNLVFTSSPLFDDDAAATSDIAGFYTFTDTAVAWGNDCPFFIYATYDTSDNPFIFISACPNLESISSNSNRISYHNTIGSVQDKYSIFVLSSSLTPANLAGQPCIRIGAIAMTKSASDDWTVTGYSNDGYGIGRFAENRAFLFPTGQIGAASGRYMPANGGTPPSFTTQSIYFKHLGITGLVHLQINLDGDGGTDGSGAVAAQIAVPFSLLHPAGNTSTAHSARIRNAASDWHGFLISSGSFLGLRVNNTVNAISTVNHSDFPNGDREVRANVIYQAF